jgi:cytoskeleton protein RodZ
LAGEILKHRREDLGLEIHEIAESLKIGEDYLAAIENDAFEKLPVPVYTMGYIRCYAAFVGIDADSIIQFYREHLSQPQPSTIIPIAFSQKKSSRLGYLVAVMGLLFVAFLLFPRVPKERNVDSVAGSPAAGRASAGGAAAGSEPAQRGEVFQHSGGGEAIPVRGPELPEKQAASGEHNLSVTAADTTWISVTFENGRREEMLLRPGQSKNWPFSGKASLKVGNAGGININLDGRDLGKPGGPGQVRTVTLPAAETGE